MKLTQRILRFLAPDAEKQRQELRENRAYARAQTEDLSRTLVMQADEIVKMLASEKG
jgi:hypothetical protein